MIAAGLKIAMVAIIRDEAADTQAAEGVAEWDVEWGIGARVACLDMMRTHRTQSGGICQA